MNSSMKTTDPYIIAITGVIGSGKTAIASELEKQGFIVLSADKLAREIVVPGSQGLSDIVQYFGDEILTKEGILDRKKLGKIVFANKAKKEILEKILHPHIRTLFTEKAKNHWVSVKNSDHPFIFYDIPLYFETSYQHPWIRKVVTVAASKPTCLQRIMKRDGLNEEDANRRIESQISIEEKIKRSDFVIQNDDPFFDENKIKEKVDAFLLQLLASL